VLYDPQSKSWTDVVPETRDTISSASTQGGKLFLTYSRDVTSHPYVYSLNGVMENPIALPGPGTAGGFGGHSDDTSAFYAYSSFNYPSTIFRYDIATAQSSIFRESAIRGFRAQDYETVQVFYPSKDGTKVPMFLVFKRGLKLDGNNPTLLYGYGGFPGAGVQPAPPCFVRAGVRLCGRKPARRRRVRREVAPGGNEAGEAECF
jgi:prolyl oligopeptidase